MNVRVLFLLPVVLAVSLPLPSSLILGAVKLVALASGVIVRDGVPAALALEDLLLGDIKLSLATLYNTEHQAITEI